MVPRIIPAQKAKAFIETLLLDEKSRPKEIEKIDSLQDINVYIKVAEQKKSLFEQKKIFLYNLFNSSEEFSKKVSVLTSTVPFRFPHHYAPWIECNIQIDSNNKNLEEISSLLIELDQQKSFLEDRQRTHKLLSDRVIVHKLNQIARALRVKNEKLVDSALSLDSESEEKNIPLDKDLCTMEEAQDSLALKIFNEHDKMSEQLRLLDDEHTKLQKQKSEISVLLETSLSSNKQFQDDLALARSQMSQQSGVLEKLESKNQSLQQNMHSVTSELAKYKDQVFFLNKQQVIDGDPVIKDALFKKILYAYNDHSFFNKNVSDPTMANLTVLAKQKKSIVRYSEVEKCIAQDDKGFFSDPNIPKIFLSKKENMLRSLVNAFKVASLEKNTDEKVDINATFKNKYG